MDWSKVVGFLLHFCWLILLNVKESKSLETSFKFILNEDDPFKLSQDFVNVEVGHQQVLSCGDGLKQGGCLISGAVSLEKVMGVCVDDSGVFTNLFVFTSTREEFIRVLGNITRQAVQLKMRNYLRFHCRLFLFLPSCDSAFILGAGEFFKMGSNNGSGVPWNWNSDLYVVEYCKDIIMKVWEVYSVKGNVLTNLLTSQDLKSIQGVRLNMTDLLLELQFNIPKVVRRQDFKGVEITAAAFLNMDDENDNLFEVKVGKGLDGEDTFESGMSVSIFTDFRLAMKFTPKFLKIYFNLENYFETAFLSDAYPFDINLYHAGVTRNRTRVAQPLHPTYFDGVHAIFVQPSGGSVRNIYRKPFSLEMWTFLFYTWLTIWVSFKLTMYLNSKVESWNHNNFESLLWCMGTICQQGWHTIPTFAPTRVVILTSLFFSVISYSAYTGKIVSELTDVPKPIKSVSQLLSFVEKVYLVSSSDTSYDVLEGLEKVAPEVLDKIKFRPVEYIYKRLVEKPGRDCTIAWPDTFNDFIESMLMIENTGGGGGYSVEAYLCDTFTTFSFQPSSSLFIPLGSELEQIFNYRIIVGFEKGYIRRYWNTYNRNTKLYCLQNNSKVTTLGFGHVFFAFFALWAGMVVCGVFFVLEFIVFSVCVKIPVV